jgi:hypothetical protein
VGKCKDWTEGNKKRREERERERETKKDKLVIKRALLRL